MVRRTLLALTATLLASLTLLAPSALARAANPEADVSSISCTQTGDCTAVTGYNDAIGYGHGLLYTEKGGVWGAGVLAKLPANAARDPFYKFGYETEGFAPLNLFDDYSEAISDVQCSSPGNCSAIGDYDARGGALDGVFLTESDGRWSGGVEAQLPANATKRDLFGARPLATLACTSAGNCTAVGEYPLKNFVDVPVAFTETNGSWAKGVELKGSAIVTSGQHRFAKASLQSIACPAARDCVAAGTYLNDRDRATPLIARESSGKWSVTAPQMPANRAAPSQTDSRGSDSEPGAQLTAVSCPAAGHCTVAGTYTDNRFEEQPVVVTQTTTGWSRGVELTLPSGAANDAGSQAAEITEIDCSSAADCSAAGSFTDEDQNQQGLLFTEAASTWGTGVAATLPATPETAVSHQNAELASLSCVSSGNCVAVGHYTYDDPQHTQVNMVDDETGGTWAPATTLSLPTPTAATVSSYAEAIDCLPGSGTGPVAGAECTLTGGYNAGTADVRGLAASGSGGVWSRATEFSLPGVTHSELVDSLDTALRPQRYYPAKLIKQLHHYEYYFDAAEKGRLSVEWYTQLGGRRVLVGKLSAGIAGAGYHRIKLKFTAAGLKALTVPKTVKGKKSVKLTIKSSFRTAQGQTVSATAQVKLLLQLKARTITINGGGAKDLRRGTS